VRSPGYSLNPLQARNYPKTPENQLKRISLASKINNPNDPRKLPPGASPGRRSSGSGEPPLQIPRRTNHPQPAPARPEKTTQPRSTYMGLDRHGVYRPLRRRPRHAPPIFRIGCISVLFLTVCLVLSGLVFALIQGRTNIVLMGIDYVESGNSVARTDTIMLATIVPEKGYIGLLSIPRDLWVRIPGIGENRINTAHFYAESQIPGSGPQALIKTIESNFGIKIDYYIRVRFEGFREIVDALGGVDLNLNKSTAGYPPGRHHLSGRKALAFVRDRANTDDFFRMSNGQLMLKSIFLNMLNPLKWLRLPLVMTAIYNAIDTNIPPHLWPRIGMVLLFRGPNGIDYQIITRQMITPYTTNQGANVLLPNWDLIRPLVQKVFTN
jgi:LCP family protein required for cell wall assembly